MNGIHIFHRNRLGASCPKQYVLSAVIILAGIIVASHSACATDAASSGKTVFVRVGIPCNGQVTLGSGTAGELLQIGEDLKLDHAQFCVGEDGEIACVGPDGACKDLHAPILVHLAKEVEEAGGQEAALIWLDNAKAVYKGSFELSVDSKGGLSVVNIVALEDYVAGVVPYEIGASSPYEALRAQAVVARTEALGGLGRHSSQGFDLCATTHCQVYKGAGAELANPMVRQAVDSTSGEVIFYGDVPAKAANYHACCGGFTESPGDLWGTDVPYMHTVRCNGEIDACGDGVYMSEEDVRNWIETPDPKDYCYGSNGYRWSVVYSQEALAEILQPVIGRGVCVESLEVAARTPRGAAVRLVIHTSSGDFEVAGEYAIRLALGGTQSVKSGVFVVNAYGDAPAKFELVGAGYGHGVGMCQYGARAMAKQGYDYKAILEKYYPGATVGAFRP